MILQNQPKQGRVQTIGQRRARRSVQKELKSVSEKSLPVSIFSVKIAALKRVRHVTGNDEDYLRKIPRVVVQKSALYKGPL